MKRIFFILFLITSHFSFSKTNFFPKQILEITFSPEYSYRFVTENDSYSWLSDKRNEIEEPKFGYTLGFKYTFRLKNKFSLETGALYSNKGYQTKKLDLIYNDPEPDSPSSLHKRYTFNFFEIPLRLNYQLCDSSAFFISLGFALDFPTSENVKTFYQYSDGHESESSSFSTTPSSDIFLSASGGIGYYFKLGKNLYLKTEPFFKCNITPSKGNNLKEYFYSYGLDIGFCFTK